MKIYEFFENLIEMPDVVELFGDTGTLKSFLTWNLMKELAQDKKKVLYIDTERNITKSELDEMKKKGIEYVYIPSFEDLIEYIDNLAQSDKKYNWLVLDSIGLPALGKFAVENLQGRGNILLNIQAILYKLKIFSAKTNCYCLVINQPTSEMNKTEWINYQPKNWNRVFKFIKTDPFGDKGSFFVKEIVRTVKIFSNTQKTIVDLIAWRSRKYPDYTTLARITRQGNEIKWEVF